MARKQKTEHATEAEMRARRKQVRELYLLRGYRPPEIAEILIERHYFAANQNARALRFAQEEVKSIRDEAEPETILRLQIPAETERYRQRLLWVARMQHDVITDEEEVKRQVVTPRGDVATVFEPRVSIQEKNKALRALTIVNEKLALLDGVDTKGDRVPTIDEAETLHAPEGGLTIIESDASIEELIPRNLDVN